MAVEARDVRLRLDPMLLERLRQSDVCLSDEIARRLEQSFLPEASVRSIVEKLLRGASK